ncbi:cell division protein FtsZ [Parapedobacter sp. ISTM3]|uniref:Cell division protein FtsZ n=1 Tax=Parapedobacter luteus TaxID=623280 RepID=A0A1T5E179_9SPHI|nr:MULTISPECIES: cell division protein FtsZ [Parapedobacter]MBK1441008.1 cell division protein FtsZ [Parapedobacter sp. ISTM3]SKB77681.1 cell division protein FtsZ [Parapedobacter luteus]
MSFKFEMLKEQSAIIKVIGVGGGGGNAVNHMYKQGISGVDFIVCNTDAQALELSPIPNKVQLGASLTEGMGAGADPTVGENSAIESIEDIKRMLGSNTKMLFITAGMGGGTGTGASPVLAKAAKELGILTVAIVTTPFAFEGKRRRMQAEEGLGELKKYVDSYLVISNDRLRDIFGNLTMTAAFAKADDILTTAAKGIAEIITIPGYVNVDFKDVRTVMNDSGVAIMGNAVAEGEQRALRAVEGALASPLLKDNEIEGARYILLNITSGKQEVTMDEVTIITDYIQEKAGLSADLIWGNCINESLENELSVTIIATGFQTSEERKKEKENERIEIPLTPEEPKAPYVKPINQFVQKDKGVADPAPVAAKPAVTEEPTIRPVTQQVDLFSAPSPSSSKPQLRNSTPDKDGIIRHTLTPQNEQANEDEQAADGFEVKVTPSPFHFELPTRNDEIREPDPEPEAYKEKLDNVARSPEQGYQANDHRTPEEVEKELLTVKDRIFRLKQLSLKLKSANGLQELESEPAYRRKQLALDDVPHSSESQVSRFTLSTEEGITEIRPNNSFLHDNVD